jgi:hypothetical protein
MASVITGRSSAGADRDPPAIEVENTEIAWRWATAAEMQTLRLLHFQAEGASGQASIVPPSINNTSDPGEGENGAMTGR